jgi:hypothetical protein
VPETQWGTAIVMNHGRGDDSISADIFHALLREVGLLPRASLTGPSRNAHPAVKTTAAARSDP